MSLGIYAHFLIGSEYYLPKKPGHFDCTNLKEAILVGNSCFQETFLTHKQYFIRHTGLLSFFRSTSSQYRWKHKCFPATCRSSSYALLRCRKRCLKQYPLLILLSTDNTSYFVEIAWNAWVRRYLLLSSGHFRNTGFSFALLFNSARPYFP